MADMNFGVNLLPVTTATYSIGSSSKKWQINGVSDPQLTDTTYSNLTAEEDGTAISLVTTGEKYIWNHIADDKVLRDGDIMTGDLFIRRESPNLSLQDGLNFNDNTFRINMFLNSTNGNHGLWSSGYFNGSTFTDDPKSMIYRNSTGEIIVNGRASENAIIVASGTQSIASVPTSSSNVTITFSPTLADTNYIVIATPNVNSINVGVQQKQTNNFKLFYKSNTGSTVTNATVNWAILKL